jgi:putative hydrolase of the HAD superfamily
VLDALGIAEAFEAVFAIEDKGFAAKPTRAAFAHVLEETGADPRRAVMVEDTSGNLVEPRRLGMTTVWLAEGAAGTPGHVDHRIDDLTAFLEAAV